MKRLLNIPDPCFEDWNKMEEGEKRRFCQVCQTKVMDFTQMNQEEILEYLYTHKNKKVCGRLSSEQMNWNTEEYAKTLHTIAKKTKNTNLAFYLLSLGSILLATSCNTSSIKHPNMVPIEEPTKIDTVKTIKLIPIKIGTIRMRPIIAPEIDSLNTTGIKNIENQNIIIGKPVSPTLSPTNRISSVKNFSPVEIMPEFPGGINALETYLRKNLTYPEWEGTNNIQGTVILSFIIDENGSIHTPYVLKSVENSKNFNAEAIRLIENMPKWIPGKNNNQPVATQYNLNIEFKL